MIQRLSCLIGRHAWAPHVNREAAGRDGAFSLCTRCGKEKTAYGPPTAGGATGLGM